MCTMPNKAKRYRAFNIVLKRFISELVVSMLEMMWAVSTQLNWFANVEIFSQYE